MNAHLLSRRSLCLFSAALATLLLPWSAAHSFGQGTVNFNNRITDVLVTHVYSHNQGSWYDEAWAKTGNGTNDFPVGTQTYSGAMVTGSGWRAQLWAAPGANQPESALQPANPIATFRTGRFSGTVAPVTATLAGVPVDCPVATVQLRVWDDRTGLYPDWNSAFGTYLNGIIEAGWSPRFNVYAIGGGTNGLPNLLGLQSFNTLKQPGMDFPIPPIINRQPANQSVGIGGNIIISAASACPACNSQEWLFNGVSMAFRQDCAWDPATNQFTYPSVPGASGIVTTFGVELDAAPGGGILNSLVLTNVQPPQAGIYSLKVVNRCCNPDFYPLETITTVSSNAVLTVGNPGALTARREQLPQIVLNWDGVFFLQSATNISGPFTDLPGPIVFGPYTNTDLAGPRFFRLRN